MKVMTTLGQQHRDSAKRAKLEADVHRLREALEELVAAWPDSRLPPQPLCMKITDAINRSKPQSGDI